MNYCFEKYEEDQIILYGDIFGFTSIMSNIERNNNKSEGLSTFLDNIYNITIFGDSEKWKKKGVTFIWLSDSFAFAGAKSNWFYIKNAFLEFANVLLTSDLIFSCAIDVGNLHVQHNIMGRTFCDATKMQSKIHLPEIILSDKVDFINDKELYCKNKKRFWNYLIPLLDYNQTIENIIIQLIDKGKKHKKRRVSKKYKVLEKLLNNKR